MQIIPAIDIRGGKCVRLAQGDYARETVFSDDPVAMAKQWAQQGATRLHVVDLDGAATGRPRNIPLIERIARESGCAVQVGGGIRDLATVERLLALGADRVVLGTAAVEVPDTVREAARRWPDAIIVAVDARDGWVATRGWLQSTTVRATDLVREMQSAGVGRFLYTDVARDGMLTGPNVPALQELVRATGAKVIASGGVATVEDVRRLIGTGVESVIIGRALYTGAIQLPEALKAAQSA